MTLTDIHAAKQQHRARLAQLPFEAKIAILINMQRMAREMAQAAGRPFQGVVWGESAYTQPRMADTHNNIQKYASRETSVLPDRR